MRFSQATENATRTAPPGITSARLTVPPAPQYTELRPAETERRFPAASGDIATVNEERISELIEASAARDRAAFIELFDYFAPRIKAYGMKGGATASEAEDLAQETMISVWRGAHRFDRRRATGATWIFTIARNRRIDLWRRESRPEIDSDDPGLADGPEVPPDHSHEAHEAGRHLHAAVGALPPEQSAVLRKAFFEDKSHGAISDELGLPLGTVKSRIRLGLARLKVLMAGFEP